MGDTAAFDTAEQANVLIKTAFGFPSTNENREWYEEIAVPFNNYFFGDEILVEEVPAEPDFNTNGTALTATEIGLTIDDFVNYTLTTNLSECSIVEDSTRKVRRYKGLKLDSVLSGLNPNTGEYMSYSKTAKETTNIVNKGTNLLINGLQMNYKQVGAYAPYKYDLYSTKTGTAGNGLTKILLGNGSWFIDLKSGVLLFNDIDVVSDLVNNTDIPVLDPYYVYVGKKGLSDFVSSTSGASNATSTGATSNIAQNFESRIDTGSLYGYRNSADEIYGIGPTPSDAIVVGASSLVGENEVVKTDVSYVDVFYSDETDLKIIKLTESPEFTDNSLSITGYFDTSFVKLNNVSNVNVNDGIVIPVIDFWNEFKFTNAANTGTGFNQFYGSIIPFYKYNTINYLDIETYQSLQRNWNIVNYADVYDDLSWNYFTYTEKIPSKVLGWNVPVDVQGINHAYPTNFIESIDGQKIYLKFSNFNYVSTGRQLQIKVIPSNTYEVATIVNFAFPNTVVDDVIVLEKTAQTLTNKSFDSITVTGATYSNTFNVTSDARLKTDIAPILNGLEKVCALQGVEFRFLHDERKQIGFIAQDVESVIPELVFENHKDENRYKSVTYGNITALLVESIKELKNEISDLKKQIKNA